jgi:DNA-binding NarL/FixJ family response regulator
LPSLYLDDFTDAAALRRRISNTFLRAGWIIVDECGGADISVLDSAAISETVLAECKASSGRAVVLVWGADDPVFASGLIHQADGVVNRDDPEDDWLRAAHEVMSGFGWISPPLVPRYRAMSSPAAPAASGHDTWQRVLSSAEYDIARLAVRGLSNAEIAEERWVREGTIKQQLTSIYRKLGIRGRPALISLGHRRRRF